MKFTANMPVRTKTSEIRKHQLFRMNSNDRFSPPFSEMESITASTDIMRAFERGYIREVDDAERTNVPEKPFTSDMSRPEAFQYLQHLIAALQRTSEPRLLDLQSLPTIDEADAEQIFREIGEQNVSMGAQAEAIRLWTEIHCEYLVKRHTVSQWRNMWTQDLQYLADEYYSTFDGLNEEEQKLLLAAFEIADPEKSVLGWIAMMGPRDSSVYALARASSSS